MILDNGQFQQYRTQLRKTVETIGGKYLAEGEVETLDGRPLPSPAESIIVAEFASIRMARKRLLRPANVRSAMMLLRDIDRSRQPSVRYMEWLCRRRDE